MSIHKLYDTQPVIQHPPGAVRECIGGMRRRELDYLREMAKGPPPRCLGSACFNKWNRRCQFHRHCYGGMPFSELAEEGWVEGRWPHHKEG